MVLQLAGLTPKILKTACTKYEFNNLTLLLQDFNLIVLWLDSVAGTNNLWGRQVRNCSLVTGTDGFIPSPRLRISYGYKLAYY
jgi:hypothetical protein